MSSKRLQGSREYEEDDDISGTEEKLLASLKVERWKANCLKAIQNSTSIPGKHTHKAFVCIVCDQIFVGKEKIVWISMKTLLDNEQRLSVGRYEHNVKCTLPKALRKQIHNRKYYLMNLV